MATAARIASPRPRPPSVERLVRASDGATDGRRHDTVVEVARAVVADERDRLRGGAEPRALPELAADLHDRLASLDRPQGPIRVINATGVLVHTNLGRSRWPAAAIEAAAAAAADYVMLELEPTTGRRGARYRVAEELLIELTGAEDALVTNNNAAAVALAVGLAGRGGVIVSRGELVEIGGGVRIPEIVRRAGARLVEVGTTNRTRVGDFEEALGEGRGRLVLRVHRSNFRLDGFAEDPAPRAVVEAAHRHGAIVVDDLGSGALVDTARFGMAHEPTPRERLDLGSDIVTFSGDKLLGGPQAGLIVGRRELVARIRRDPLARAMRPDKSTLAAVAATLAIYRGGRAEREIPTLVALATPAESIHARAEALSARIPGASVVPVESTVGGGALPGQTLPSFGVAIGGGSAGRLAAALRPQVVARIERRRVVLDLRTVDPADDDRLAAHVLRALDEVAAQP